MIREKLWGNVDDKLSAGIYTMLQFVVLGIIAWATGRPFIFPSLGPSAYLMATGEVDRAEGGYHIIGGHTVAVITGMIAYHPIAAGIASPDVFGADPAAFSPDVLLLAISATIGMVLCTIAMLVVKTNHPAACATVLIVALGIMADPLDGAIIIGAVIVLYVHQEKIVYPLAIKYGFEPEDPRPNDDG